MGGDLLSLDGAQSGGGQMLRGALSLSLATGRGFEWISRPTLAPSDVTFIRAAAQVGRAFVEGVAVGSGRMVFVPQGATAGDHLFELEGPASAALATQMLTLPLARLSKPSMLLVRGGTHLSGGPSFHYLAAVWAPLLARIGFALRVSMPRAAFFGGPASHNGEIATFVSPAERLHPLFLPTRGTLLEVQVLTLVAGPFDGAERMGTRAVSLLRARGIVAESESVPMQSSDARGAAISIVATFEHSRAAFTAQAAPGERADKLAEQAVGQFGAFLERRGAVDPFMADQLVPPLALAASDHASRFATTEVTAQLLRQAKLAEQFLPVRIEVEGALGAEGDVTLTAR